MITAPDGTLAYYSLRCFECTFPCRAAGRSENMKEHRIRSSSYQGPGIWSYAIGIFVNIFLKFSVPIHLDSIIQTLKTSVLRHYIDRVFVYIIRLRAC